MIRQFTTWQIDGTFWAVGVDAQGVLHAVCTQPPLHATAYDLGTLQQAAYAALAQWSASGGGGCASCPQ